MVQTNATIFFYVYRDKYIVCGISCLFFLYSSNPVSVNPVNETGNFQGIQVHFQFIMLFLEGS